MIALCLAVLVASPESTDAEAKSLYEAGSLAYRKKQYPVAIRALEAAYALSAKAPVAFSLAQAHRLQYFAEGDPAHLARAVELYAGYLEMDPDGPRRQHAIEHLGVLRPILLRVQAEAAEREPAPPPPPPPPPPTQLIVSSAVFGAVAAVDGGEPAEVPALFTVTPGRHKVRVEAPEHRAEETETVAVEGRLVAVDVSLVPEPARLIVEAPEGAEIRIDGRSVGLGPSVGPLEVPAGERLVTITERGRHPYAERLTLTRGESRRIAVELETTGQRTAATIGLATGGTLLAAGGLFGLFALGEESFATDQLERHAGRSFTLAELADLEDHVGRRDQLQSLALIVGLSGAVLTLTGALLFALDDPTPPSVRSEAELEVTPWIGDSPGVSLRGRF